jgi:hypothetical protein
MRRKEDQNEFLWWGKIEEQNSHANSFLVHVLTAESTLVKALVFHLENIYFCNNFQYVDVVVS